MQINSLMAPQLLGEKDESIKLSEKDEPIKLSSFVAAFDAQAHRCSRGSIRICQFLTAGIWSCVSGAQGCCCCSWRCLDRHWHQRQEKLRKIHRPFHWSGANFRGGLPPVGRPVQRRRWRPEPGSRMWRSPATSEALQLGVLESPKVQDDSINCVAEAARCQLDQFERSKLRMAPRFANLVAMFGQFVRRRVFLNVKATVTAVSLTTFGNIERPKMWNRQLLLQMVGLAKSHLPEERQQIAVLWSPQSPFEHSRCFGKDTKGADGAADLLEVLRNSPLEKLYFEYCSQIPSTAWQKLRGASWTNLREANFSWCLVLQTWLRCLASSLDAVFFLEC